MYQVSFEVHKVTTGTGHSYLDRRTSSSICLSDLSDTSADNATYHVLANVLTVVFHLLYLNLLCQPLHTGNEAFTS